MKHVDESNIPLIFWFVFLAVTNAMWICGDIWLKRHGHEYLTTEFKEGLKNQVIGPILAFVTVGSFAAFAWHMLTGPKP